MEGNLVPLNIIKEKEEQDKKMSPHLAVTHNDLQGGAANGRNVSLLLKADAELDEEAKSLLKSILGVDADESIQTIQKASYEQLRTKLSDAIKKFSIDRWEWAYVEDFDNQYVVFYNDQGLFYTEYTLSDNQVVLGDVAYPVNRIVSFEAKTGTLLMSDSTSNSTTGAIPEGVYSLIVKSFDSISSNEKIKAIYKSKHENEVKNVEQEIQKAVEAKQAELTKALADLEKAVQERDALRAQVDEIVKAQAEAKAAQRLEVVKSVIKEEEQAVAFAKSVEALGDEAFETVVKALKLKDEVVDQSDLFKTKSGATVESGTQESGLAALLKQKYQKEQA
jgi:hypothetical protein